MANPEHVEIVKQGADAIREWREKNPGIRLDLSGADFSEARLRKANLVEANLVKARLHDTDLNLAELIGAKLVRAELNGADLSYANLNEADLSCANLSWSCLRGGHFIGTNFESARCMLTVFANADLSKAQNLRTVVHDGPSTIGADTIYLSKGEIPDVFLRGCGVPENLITYLPALLGQPIEFYSCFISYSTKDEEFCKRLHSRMRDEHLRVWFAPEDIKGGKKIHEQIDEAIRVHDKLLLVLSEASMKSEWVKTEIYHARQREAKEGKQVFFPIRLVPFERIEDWKVFDADIGKDMAREVREYFIPDFSNWKDHDAFEAAFKRLLDDLKASARSN